MIKGKLLWWESSVISGITTLSIQTVPPGMETSGRVVDVTVTRGVFKKFYNKVGSPARKFISYENGRLKLEE